MKIEIKKQYEFLFFIVACILGLVSFLEQINTSHANSIDIFEQILFTFGQAFIYLNILYFAILSVRHQSRYLISISIVLIFSIYLFFSLNVGYYTLSQNLLGACVYTGIFALLIASLDYFVSEKHVVLVVGLLLIFMASISMIYNITANQEYKKSVNQDTKRIYINVGESINTVRTYNLLLKTLQKENVNQLEDFKQIQKNILQIRMETMLKLPFYQDILIENGFCNEWKTLQNNDAFRDFSKDANITVEKLEQNFIQQCAQK